MEENRERVSRRANQKKLRKNRIKTTISYILLCLIAGIISYMVYGIYRESKIRTIGSENNIERVLQENVQNTQDFAIAIKNINLIEDSYKGYDVDSKLQIPKIGLDTNVLAKYSKEGLDVCASKYYGPSANEVGNYCIAAHNKENMFNHIIELEVRDSIFLTDNKNGILEYEVYDIYKVKPQNTNPLSQETSGKREITLITCVNYSQNRLIVKAVEKTKK